MWEGEVTELAESLEPAVAILSRHSVVKLAKQDIGEYEMLTYGKV